MVLTTIDDRARAVDLARALVSERLAACVQILPVTSVYRWDGEVRSDDELALMIKTRSDHVERVAQYITAHHPYDLPEVVALPIEGGAPAYLAWLDREVGG